MAAEYKTPAALLDYYKRVGAEELNWRRAIIKEHKSNYYIEKTLISIRSDGSISCTNPEYAPMPEEEEAIKAAFLGIEFPRAIGATKANIEQLLSEHKLKLKNIFCMYSVDRSTIKMVQERRQQAGRAKSFHPWTLFSDGVWRSMEPDGDLPFWKPENDRGKARIMVHEGAKAAHHIDWMLNDKSPEAKKARRAHPWSEELSNFEHWGILGGALAPHRADYSELKSLKLIELVYFCDNDWPGKSVLQVFSKHYGKSMNGVMLDEKWPDSWDCADAMPEEFFGKTATGQRIWRGPCLKDLTISATRATELQPNPSGKGRDIATLRTAFKEEWMHSVQPELFVHRDWPNRLLSGDDFNSLVRPFSDVTDTAKLMRAEMATKAFSIHYNPTQISGIISSPDKSGRSINTFVPTPIKPEKWGCEPWLEFLTKLIPSEDDRYQVMRWCATLIARPDVKILYGLLLVSEIHGAGKTTLGETILAPLVGIPNVSFPSESDIVESAFNAWIAHKRLAVVHEVYAGSSSKAYNKLKSIITDRFITVNKKHQSTYEIENWIHVFACSNSDRALKLSFGDRRWFVPEIAQEHFIEDPRRRQDYWRKLYSWLNDQGGLSAIMYWAQEFVTTKEENIITRGEIAPDSTTKMKMIEEQLSPGMRLVSDMLDHIKSEMNGHLVFVTDHALIKQIKLKLYDGRNSDKLERPATIRRLAKAKGWSISEAPTKAFSGDGTKEFLLSPSKEIAKKSGDRLKSDGQNPIDFNKLLM